MKNLLFLLAIAALPGAAQELPASSALGQNITGAFFCPAVSITSALPPGVATSFPGAISFFSDGNVIGQANGDGPAAISHGTWLRTGNRTFQSTWVGFAQDDKLRYTGPTKVLYNFKLDSDLVTLYGAYRIDFFDAKGNKLFSFSGKATCTRVLVEPFEDQP